MELSIIIPMYNGEKYIERCLNSIYQNNNNDSFEVLIINDGSTDKSMNIIKKCKKKYNNLIIIDKQNEGVSISRNIGIENSRGDYIMFVDADDELKLGWYDEVKKNTNQGEDIIYFSKHKLNDSKDNLLEYIIGCNDDEICIAGPYSKLFKRNLILRHHIQFNHKIINGEDMLFNIECLNHSRSIRVVNYSFYLYRIYVGQTTKQFNDYIFESDLYFHDELKKHLDESSYDIQKMEILKNYCLSNAIIMLYDRISYINSFQSAKDKINKLYLQPYNMADGKSVFKTKISKLKYLLYKYKLKKILYYLFKLSRKFKYSNDKEQFIEI